MAQKYEDARIREALELLNEVAAEKRTQLQDLVVGRYENLRAFLDALGPAAQKEVTGMYEAGKEKVQETIDDVERKIKANPWGYLGATAGIALLVGYLMGRSRK